LAGEQAIVRLPLTDPTEGSSEPGRFWTVTNTSEACPEVMTPFCWTFWRRINQFSVRQAWYDFGLIAKSQIPIGTDPNLLMSGCFYGRQAINVDAVRAVLALAPGTSPDDFERDAFGAVRPDAPPVKESMRRYPPVAFRLPQAVLRQRRRIQPLHDEQAQWWRAEVLSGRPTVSPRQLLIESEQRYQRAMRLHLYSRTNLLPTVQGQLTTLAASAGGPDLASRLLSGSGRTAETQIAHDMWALSRGQLTRSEFLWRHGFHGPAEGNPVSRSWREDATPLDSLLASYSKRPDSDAPYAREETTARGHQEAVQELMSALSPARRALARILLSAFRTQVRYLGLGKAAFLMGLDGARAGVRGMGAELVAAGITDDPDDAFYLTFDELLGPVPENFAELVAFRRARRTQYQQWELPVTWHGMPTPIETQHDSGTRDLVVGSPGSGGTAEGRVLVVDDPGDSDDLEPGDVLVCRFTDPSWAALFPLAAAVVIDIGGPASHGAMVARELGIPCVIGTGDGSRALQTGDVVRVDGTAGTVTVLERRAPAQAT
jgi:phosphohistidine swiveling domain-containing protein